MLTHSAAGDVWDVCPGPGCGSASGAAQLRRPHIGDHFPNLWFHIRFSAETFVTVLFTGKMTRVINRPATGKAPACDSLRLLPRGQPERRVVSVRHKSQ